VDSIPDPALVVLVGPAGAGKTTWAEARFRPEEIVSSDRLRAVVGSGPHDLAANAQAFDLLDRIVEARLGRRLLTVVDTLGLDDDRRARQLELARRQRLPALAVVFDVPEATARERNQRRPRPVPASALKSQIRRYRQIRPRLAEEGWTVLAAEADVTVRPAHLGDAPRPAAPGVRAGLRIYLQLSRFVGPGPLAGWLREMVAAAEVAGFSGLAVMDHLVQIPQVGRPWEALPEAYTTLSYLSAISDRLQLGTLVTNPTLRSPALLAKMLATLDVMSGGRTFCGLGIGWHRDEQEAYGIEFPARSRRLAILADTVGILRAMWAPGSATFTGEVHGVAAAVSYPRPLGRIPLWIGGRSRSVVELAGRAADGINLVGTNGLEERWRWARAAAMAAGREPEEIELSVLDTPLLGKDRSEVAHLVEVNRGRVAASRFAFRHHAGTVADHLERLRGLAANDVSAVFLAPVGLSGAEHVLAWEPVIAALRG
jgi:alkanesulfonate monooxygenase SsuD/methylene tetrahydromethanopterin reductase-like flavin-dependent oxidoreductase (luciferase family)/predicted kinase